MLVKQNTKIPRGGLDIVGKGPHVMTDFLTKIIRANHQDLSFVRIEMDEDFLCPISNTGQTVVKGGKIIDVIWFDKKYSCVSSA